MHEIMESLVDRMPLQMLKNMRADFSRYAAAERLVEKIDRELVRREFPGSDGGE